MFPFQVDGVKFAIQCHGRFLRGDEMGVGKTIQSLAISLVYQSDWPVIVVCPSGLRYNWKEEILKWMPDVHSSEIHLLATSKECIMNRCKFYIMSFDAAVKISDQFLERGVGVAIVDEAHYLKGLDSQRSRSLVPVISRIKRVLLLSGTPILSRPVEIFNLMRMVRPDIMVDFQDYAQRYCAPTKNRYCKGQIDFNGAANTDELNYILDRKIVLRRLKKEVLKDLPDKIRQKINVTCDREILSEIAKILRIDFQKESDRLRLEQILVNRNRQF
jgi:SWI/SNF-related matrix-associated actin-dependent regulator 1 of chromatin subfamily A